MLAFLIVCICMCAVGAAAAFIGALFSDESESRLVCGWNCVTCLLAIVGLSFCVGAL